MRIWHQSGLVFEKAPVYQAALEEHVKAIAGEGVVVDVHGVAPGWLQQNESQFPQDQPSNRLFAYIMSLRKEQFVRAALQAEAEGYDAYFISMFADLGFEEIRSLVNIPVIGYCQSSMLFGATLGQPIGFVLFVEAAEAQLERLALLYGLRDLVGPVVQASFGYPDVMAAFEDPTAVVEEFKAAAQRAVDLGAKVLVPGEGPLNVLLARSGVSQVSGVPVLDSIGIGVAYAEMRARFHQLTGLTHAQTGFYYATPPPALVQGLRQQYYGDARN